MRVLARNITKRFGATAVLKDISLEIASRELLCLLGPSGCGKTTLLRILAGFYQPDSGELFFGDRPLQGVPPHRRNTGMVFQNYALWPHLTVAENVVYGLEVRKIEVRERRQRTAEALAMVQMSAYAERLPNQLSGGQQQRVALARALVVRPDVLLLDEPLSNLDAKLRLELREEIRRIHALTQLTTIHVTHDQKEALSLASRLAILREGRIEQIGAPREVYRQPVNRFVAEFIGEMNWLSATLESATALEWRLRTPVGTFLAPPAQAGVQSGAAKHIVGFRPEAVRLVPAEINTASGVIRSASYQGETELYQIEVAPNLTIKALEQNPRIVRHTGETLVVHVPFQDLLVLADV